jgi:hypothetical protein
LRGGRQSGEGAAKLKVFEFKRWYQVISLVWLHAGTTQGRYGVFYRRRVPSTPTRLPSTQLPACRLRSEQGRLYHVPGKLSSKRSRKRSRCKRSSQVLKLISSSRNQGSSRPISIKETQPAGLRRRKTSSISDQARYKKERSLCMRRRKEKVQRKRVWCG